MSSRHCSGDRDHDALRTDYRVTAMSYQANERFASPAPPPLEDAPSWEEMLAQRKVVYNSAVLLQLLNRAADGGKEPDVREAGAYMIRHKDYASQCVELLVTEVRLAFRNLAHLPSACCRQARQVALKDSKPRYLTVQAPTLADS